MGDRRSSGMGMWCAFGIFLVYVGLAAAEGARVVVTVDKPGSITATAAPAPERRAVDQSPHVIISVTGFQPPQDGAVQAVVKVQREDTGTEQEIGRFGIFPHAAFKAEPSKAQRFALPLSEELASGAPVHLKVYLVPFPGEGKGAWLEVGGAEIRYSNARK
jgi:hypothetical protein